MTTEEKGEKLTFQKIWEDFTETTALHAVNKIQFGKKYPIARSLFWVILWLLSAGYLMYILTEELMYYYQYPTTTTVSARMADELEFPIVTVCNLSSRKRSKISSDSRHDNYYLNISAIPYLAKPIDWTDPFYTAEGYFTERTLEDLYKESKNISQFIQQPLFDLVSDTINITPVATDLGLCSRVTPLKTTQLFGGLYNLHLYIDLMLDDDYYSSNYLSSGIKVAVHNKNKDIRMTNEGFVVPPASEAFVEVTRNEYKFKPLPYKAFENDACELKDGTYSKSKCMKECFRQEILKNCSCVDFMFESENGKYCSKERYINCFRDVYRTLIQSSQSSPKCDCPIACEYIEYDTSVSFGRFPSTFNLKDLSKLLNESEDYIGNNYISLKIFYKNLNTIVTEQTPIYGNMGDVFSNIGGQMGLFLGASILTVVELGEFIVFITWYIIVKLTRRSVIAAKGTELHLT